MRDVKVFAGERILRLRSRRPMTQAGLAATLGLSASYLNQIERNQRPIPAPLMQALCEFFGVQPSYFADAKDFRLASDLREASGDPLFGARPISQAEASAAVRASPEMVHRMLTLYRAYRGLAEDAGTKMAPANSSPEAASPFPYDEVRDWVQSQGNYFDELDRAAEELHAAARLSPSQPREGLIAYLERAHRITVEDTAGMLGTGTLWRLDRGAGRLFIAEEASPESRAFYVAHVIGALEQKSLIDRIAARAKFTSHEARDLARVGLANYFAGALILPYRRFLEEADRARHDVQRLQARFQASFEQVCHRLSTMQRPGLAGIPFYFLKTDIAGNVLKRNSATNFRFARFGGACPLWNVYQAFAQPGRICVQLARVPDGSTFLCVARTVGAAAGSYLSRPRSVAVGLGCDVEQAARLVYAEGLDLHSPGAADPIGPGCRACERTDCRHRALPPVGLRLDVGTSERGVVPYQITD